jgi:hypothetical protein
VPERKLKAASIEGLAEMPLHSIAVVDRLRGILRIWCQPRGEVDGLPEGDGSQASQACCWLGQGAFSTTTRLSDLELIMVPGSKA